MDRDPTMSIAEARAVILSRKNGNIIVPDADILVCMHLNQISIQVMRVLLDHAFRRHLMNIQSVRVSGSFCREDLYKLNDSWKVSLAEVLRLIRTPDALPKLMDFAFGHPLVDLDPHGNPDKIALHILRRDFGIYCAKKLRTVEDHPKRDLILKLFDYATKPEHRSRLTEEDLMFLETKRAASLNNHDPERDVNGERHVDHRFTNVQIGLQNMLWRLVGYASNKGVRSPLPPRQRKASRSATIHEVTKKLTELPTDNFHAPVAFDSLKRLKEFVEYFDIIDVRLAERDPERRVKATSLLIEPATLMALKTRLWKWKDLFPAEVSDIICELRSRGNKEVKKQLAFYKLTPHLRTFVYDSLKHLIPKSRPEVCPAPPVKTRTSFRRDVVSQFDDPIARTLGSLLTAIPSPPGAALRRP